MNEREQLFAGLIHQCQVDRGLRGPDDRIQRALAWLSHADPSGHHRGFIIDELRRVLVQKSRTLQIDYSVEERILDDLESEEWFKKQT